MSGLGIGAMGEAQTRQGPERQRSGGKPDRLPNGRREPPNYNHKKKNPIHRRFCPVDGVLTN